MRESIKFKAVSESGDIFSGSARLDKGPGRAPVMLLDNPEDVDAVSSKGFNLAVLCSGLKYLMAEEIAVSVKMIDNSEIFKIKGNEHE